MLGQQKVAEKSNEITAIPTLLEALVLKDCIITIDAMGCQTNIAEAIIKKEADYILALKGNRSGEPSSPITPAGTTKF
jgi:predicted transposase YbfD/YdcC